MHTHTHIHSHKHTATVCTNVDASKQTAEPALKASCNEVDHNEYIILLMNASSRSINLVRPATSRLSSLTSLKGAKHFIGEYIYA
jgi:hypothetical protein